MEASYDARTPRHSFVRLTRWWQTATEAQRLEALKASIRGDEGAPPLQTLHWAALGAALADQITQAAREGQRSSEASHGAAPSDAA